MESGGNNGWSLAQALALLPEHQLENNAVDAAAAGLNEAGAAGRVQAGKRTQTKALAPFLHMDWPRRLPKLAACATVAVALLAASPVQTSAGIEEIDTSFSLSIGDREVPPATATHKPNRPNVETFRHAWKCLPFKIGSGSWFLRFIETSKMLEEKPSHGAGVVIRKKIADQCRNLSGMDLLKAVNKLWNRIPYRSDMEVWKKPDKWARPEDFAVRGGDCEDFALAKRATLQDLGWPDDKLWIVGFRPFPAKKLEGHVMLAAELNGKLYALDLGRDVCPAEDARPDPPAFAGSGKHGFSFLLQKDTAQPDSVLKASAKRHSRG